MKKWWHIVLALVLSVVVSKLKEIQHENADRQLVVAPAKQLELPPVDDAQLTGEQDRLQIGTAFSTLDDSYIDQASLDKQLGELPTEKRYWSYQINDRNKRLFTYAATAVNKQHYIANSYLLGFVPFETEKIWVPLASLSQRKRYLFDHKLYGLHMQDVWQNSKQAYAYSHGDCEDHALLLADWLIGLGYDAKVALGELPSGGHAWVVLNHRGQDYVLEATNKQHINSIHDFMPAIRATDYRPRVLFNREFLWVNTGSTLTTQYRGKHWSLRSRFKRTNTITQNDLAF